MKEIERFLRLARDLAQEGLSQLGKGYSKKGLGCYRTQLRLGEHRTMWIRYPRWPQRLYRRLQQFYPLEVSVELIEHQPDGTRLNREFAYDLKDRRMTYDVWSDGPGLPEIRMPAAFLANDPDEAQVLSGLQHSLKEQFSSDELNEFLDLMQETLESLR